MDEIINHEVDWHYLCSYWGVNCLKIGESDTSRILFVNRPDDSFEEVSSLNTLLGINYRPLEPLENKRMKVLMWQVFSQCNQ